MSAFDAAIIGAGPAGATAAILLARAGWKVAVVEKAAFPRRKVCGEYISGAAWPLLDELGVAREVAARAGPEVTRVGLFAGEVMLDAPMPGSARRGRALGREALDTILLERARSCGAALFQPFAAKGIERRDGDFAIALAGPGGASEIRARRVIAAHGAWQPGGLSTQPAHEAARDDDLLGFKARWRDARLAPGLMPLVLIPGGYGGLVHSDSGCVSFSCCVRRDALARARERFAVSRAGDALLAHALAANRGMRAALEGAALESAWLSAGPVRPAIRSFGDASLFVAGNAAGEAHPIVAEGISMAIQSSFLLCERLLQPGRERDVARDYEAAWRRNFTPRVRAASLFARILLDPFAGRAAVALLQRAPSVLTLGARWSGKDRGLRRAADLRA